MPKIHNFPTHNTSQLCFEIASRPALIGIAILVSLQILIVTVLFADIAHRNETKHLRTVEPCKVPDRGDPKLLIPPDELCTFAPIRHQQEVYFNV